MLLLFASRTLSSSIPSSHPVYASVGLLGTPEYLPYFSLSDRFSQYSLVTIARKSTKRSPTVALRYEEPRAAYQATLCLSGAGAERKRSAYTREAESGGGWQFSPVVRCQLESPRATISVSCNQ